LNKEKLISHKSDHARFKKHCWWFLRFKRNQSR